MKERMKRVAALLLCLLMAFSLAACGDGGGGNVGTGNSTNEATDTGGMESEPSSGILTDDESIYMAALGEFYDAYLLAFEADTLSERQALMALAEAKFLESGVGTPMYTAGGGYKMSRMAYRTGGYIPWMGDRVNYEQMVLTNEIITKEDYEHMVDMWFELTGTGTYTESVKAYLTEQGYTFADSYTGTFDGVGTTWDFLSSGDILDDESFVDFLYKYNSEGQLVPRLATSYDVSEDGLTYTFHIREGVIWTDSQGRKVADLVADDWVAAAQHLADTGASSIENLNGLVVGMTEYLSGETTDFSTVGIKALDDHTLQYTLTEECPYFMTMVAETAFIPMSRTYYVSQGGVFGIAEYDAAIASSSYVYGTPPPAMCMAQTRIISHTAAPICARM